MKHEHKLILIREFTGQHYVYWCRECGMIMEKFTEVFAELLPEWSKNRLLKQYKNEVRFKFLPNHNRTLPTKRLGRSLKSITQMQTSNLERMLFNGLDKKV